MLTGCTGQVGWELQRTLAPLGEVVAVSRSTIPLAFDLADPDSIRAIVRKTRPGLIVNAAAYTAVDKAEEEPELAMAVNGVAPGIMAEEAKRLGALLVHYSTDYVFDGTKDGPYTEEDEPNPLNVYGKTKLAGECAIQALDCPHMILRTSWVYGNRGKNFLLTILRLAEEREELRVVHDQTGSPTWSRMIAEATAQILAQLCALFTVRHSPFTGTVAPITHCLSPFTDVRAIYHLTASGVTSWFGFANAIVNSDARGSTWGLDAPSITWKLVPIPASDYPTLAVRPKNSVLSNSKSLRQFGVALTGWENGLRLCLADYCSCVRKEPPSSRSQRD